MTAPAPQWSRRAPVDLPGPEGDNSIAREPLWYAYGRGEDRPAPPSWTYDETPPPDTHVPPAPPRPPGPSAPLPLGTTRHLTALPYPGLPAPGGGQDALLHALTTAFAPLRREPENPYNEHRPYASPRCLFPVHAFVGGDGDGWRLLEPDRHALTGPPSAAPARIALTGRYTAIPPAYQWFRGSLVALELGMVLRALSLGLELSGVPATLTLPDGDAHALLTEAGLDRTWEWSLPWLIETVTGTPRRRSPAAVAEHPVPDDDASLADVVHVNRQQVYGGSRA
ncbi:hypothetical protein ACFWFB_32625, partial [Streptomyces albidoflavus]